MPWTRRSASLVLAALAWPATSRAAGAAAPLLDGMGSLRAPDASPSALARRYVAQGLVLGWGFNGAEAARSFDGALVADAQCAAALWGRAWALGPTLNTDLDSAEEPAVLDALDRVRVLLRRGVPIAPRWREAIAALAARHPRAGVVDEAAYATRMQQAATRHPRDADIATLAAEALLALHPYDWWRRDGRPQPWTPAIERGLEHALALDARHPGANHLWVHLLESSSAPQRAAAAAERLRTLVPGSGHLLHMPAHIDMRLGRYDAAIEANQRSIAADRRYLEQVDAQGAYRVGYVAHNHHFLWAAASMAARGALAIEAADAAWPAACGPRPATPGIGTLQLYQALPLYARVRFGRWQDLLTDVRPPDGRDPFALAIWHYARGTALLRTGRADDATREAAALERVATGDALAATRIKGVHAGVSIASIARLTLRADLARAQRREAEALEAYAQAVAIEDALDRDEPHLWLAPTRHALGDALLAAGRADEAARVFEHDLAHYPGNPWSLAGLKAALEQMCRAGAARDAAKRLAAALGGADVTLRGARL